MFISFMLNYGKKEKNLDWGITNPEEENKVETKEALDLPPNEDPRRRAVVPQDDKGNVHFKPVVLPEIGYIGKKT
jgi:hypothetical protein